MNKRDKKIAILAAIAGAAAIIALGIINNQPEQETHHIGCEARLTGNAVICR